MHFGKRDLFGALGAASPWPGSLGCVGLNLMNLQAMGSARDEQLALLRLARVLLLNDSPQLQAPTWPAREFGQEDGGRPTPRTDVQLQITLPTNTQHWDCNVGLYPPQPTP